MKKKIILSLTLFASLIVSLVAFGNQASAAETQPLTLSEPHVDSDGVTRNYDPNELSPDSIVSESPLVGITPNGEVVVIPEVRSNNPYAKKLIGDYIVNGQQVQEWGTAIQNLKGSALMEYMELGFTKAMGLVGGPAAETASAAAWIAMMNKPIQQEVLDAAASGNRLRILVYDQVPHTSYSTSLKFIGIH